MTGKRLLDIAALFNASREVAQKHVALRLKQASLYSKTSSLASAVRSQTDRVTETIKAASTLASHLNEDSALWFTGMTSNQPINHFHDSETISGTESTQGAPGSEQKVREEVHPRNAFEESSSSNKSAQELFKIQRQEVKFDAHPERNVPRGSAEWKDPSIGPGSLSFARQSEREPNSDEVNINLFHSPRVAKLLGGRLQNNSPSVLGSKTIQDTALESRERHSDKLRAHSAIFKAPNISSHRNERSGLGDVLRDGLESTSHGSIIGNHVTTENTESLRAEKGKEIEAEHDASHRSHKLKESTVPSSRLGRLLNYGGLAAGMVGGVISEGFRRAGGSGGEGSYILSTSNMDRLVTKLSRMRGAALKLGQMISFQDSKMLPAQIQEVLQRVQDRADYMPSFQRDQVLSSNLGQNWRELFSSFDEIPLAAASIGQVHRAVLKSKGAPVAVKVQYPGVAESIDSDLKNLAILLTASRLLPKGLFLDKTIANARTELAWECDYEREAQSGKRFQELLVDEKDVFRVPEIYPEASGKQVLTMEFMYGVGVTKEQSFSQDQKDWIGTQILRLCLREITEFRFMQTDPNWTNFLYNVRTRKLELLDFGASREYAADFVTLYTQLLSAASRSDKEAVQRLSFNLGYLTGQESRAMVDAHITSILTLAEPFLASSPELYDFKDQTITSRVKDLIPLMIRERLAPPPEETYSLHRKLSGAFLLCARLGSRVPCRKLFEDSMRKAALL